MILRSRRICEHVALLALPFALNACLFEAPEVPTVENEWLVPLGNHQYSLGSILDAEGFDTNSDGTLGYTTSGEIPRVSLGDRLLLDLAEDNLVATIGNVALEGLVSQHESEALHNLYPDGAIWVGSLTTVPAFQFDWTIPLTQLPALQEAHVVSGSVDLYLSSALPFAIGGADPSTEIRARLLDPAGLSLSEVQLPTSIAAGGSAYLTLDLTGLTLAPGMSLELHVGSAGSDTAIFVDSNAKLDLSVLPRTTIIDHAVAPIAAQSFGANVFVDLSNSTTVQAASIASGRLEFELASELTIPVELAVSFDNVLDEAGNPASMNVALPALGTLTQTLDLSGHRVVGNGSPLTSFALTVSGSSPGSAGDAVLFDASQSVQVRSLPTQLVFSEVESAFGPETAELTPVVASVEGMTGTDGLALTQADLSIRVFSDADVPMQLDLSLVGTLGDGSTIQYGASANSADSPGSDGSLLELHVDESDPAFLAFLNAQPVAIEFGGQATLGDGVTVSTLRAGDGIWAQYDFTVPFTIELDRDSVLLEPSALNMSASDRDALAGRLVAAELQITTRSTLPVGADIYIGIDPDLAMVHDAPQVLLGPIALAEPAAGSEDAFTEATSTVVLTQEQIDAILAGPVYMGGRLDISRARGRVISVRSDHRIELGGFVLATLNVGSE